MARKYFLISFLIFANFLLLFILFYPVEQTSGLGISIYLDGEISESPRSVEVEPEFTESPALRQVDAGLGKILSDIESHMPVGHIYRDSDKITWGHETSHGISSRLRMLHRKSGARINAFYVLNNRAVIIEEPKTTIQATARLVPRSLRGGVYNLYLVSQASSWGDTPLYLLDEYNSYSLGSEVRRDLGIEKRAETVLYMLEFNVYCIALAQAIKSGDSSYDDTQFKSFLMWCIQRSMDIYNNESDARVYWEKFQTSEDAASLRLFAEGYFGKEWSERYLFSGMS